MTTDKLILKIPFDLARFAVAQRRKVAKYETNQVIKALGTWLVLKSISRPSILQQWNAQKKYLCHVCKCSETIFRHRLKLLQDLQVLSFDRNNIRLTSWDQLGQALCINTQKKYSIHYEISDKTQPHFWIIATEIKDNQSRQDFTILKRIAQNPETNMILISALIKAGADRDRLNDTGYFLSMLRSLYYSDFVQASEAHEILVEIRPDNNRGVKGIAAAWSAKHAMTASYWKRQLQNCSILDISRLQLQSEDRVRNEHCRVLWLKKEKQTLLCLCDQLAILEPWTIQNFLAA